MFNFLMFGISFSIIVFAGALAMGMFVFPTLGIDPILGITVIILVSCSFLIWLLRKTLTERY